MCSLNAAGYKEDGAADISSGASSGGKFKYQHDTNKNLKFVHVFPNISAPAAAAGDDEEEEEEEAQPRTPEDIVMLCDDRTFDRILSEQATSYSQKKRVQDVLKARIAALEAIEAKMTNLEQVSPEEQTLFDSVGAEELRQKVKVVNAEVQKMVTEGELTSNEKSAFLEQLNEKLDALDAELSKAQSEGKEKKVQALTKQREVMQATQASVKDASPVSLKPLKHGAEISKLRRKLAELARIEKASKGNYSMAELKALGEKPELEEAVQVLEERSRGWFESDEVFQQRLDACIRAGGGAKAKAKSSSSGGYAAAAAAKPNASSNGFTTVGGKAPKAKAKSSGAATKNAFSALG
jgi:hypothetical protein